MSVAPGAVLGLGTDLVEIPRFRTVLERRPRLADRVFDARERVALAGPWW